MGRMPLHGVHATLRRYMKPLERRLHAYAPWDDLALKHHVTCNIGDASGRGVLKSEGTSEGDRGSFLLYSRDLGSQMPEPGRTTCVLLRVSVVGREKARDTWHHVSASVLPRSQALGLLDAACSVLLQPERSRASVTRSTRWLC